MDEQRDVDDRRENRDGEARNGLPFDTEEDTRSRRDEFRVCHRSGILADAHGENAEVRGALGTIPSLRKNEQAWEAGMGSLVKGVTCTVEQ